MVASARLNHVALNSTLHIRLLGGFRLSYDETPVRTLNTPRLQSLLSYLVLKAGTPQSRRNLSTSFWPDSSDAQARTNLRQLLHHLRRALPDADTFIDADTESVSWKEDAPFTLDVIEFERALTSSSLFGHDTESGYKNAEESPISTLGAAVSTYRGDLLPGCYDEWIAPERERFRQLYATALDRLIYLLEEDRSYTDAVQYARMLLQCDPLRETTYGTLMRLHALRSDRASAIRVYHDCKAVLEREMGVAPGPETQELHQRLLAAPVAADPQSTSPARRQVDALRLVGRKAEWTRLQDAWRDARRRGSRLVMIEGEAGIGKTHLAEELLTWTSKQGITAARTRCYAAEGRLALGPITEWLRSAAFSKEAHGLAAVWKAELVPILPELSAADPALPPPTAVADGWQRRRLFEALTRAVLAARQPILLVIDDLQWCDRDTLEWLHFLLRFDPAAALLVVGTIRGAEVGQDSALETIRLALRRSGQVSEIELSPLNESETTLLAEQVAGRTLDRSIAARIYRETEGNPLFIVESVRAALSGGGRTSDGGSTSGGSEDRPQRRTGAGALPEKVHAVLSARLGQLSPPARSLAHVGAVLGRAFTLEMLAAASEHDEEVLAQGLDELWQRRIIRAYGPNFYDFSHDKLREFAYSEVTPARRLLLHRRVAEAFEQLFEAEIDAFSGQIAAHYEEADLPASAIAYHERAARAARRVHAHDEEIGHLNRALTLIQRIPRSAERDEREVDLRTQLGTANVA